MEEKKQNERKHAGLASIDQVRSALESLRTKLFEQDNVKVSVADYVRLYELLRELEVRDITEVRGKWVEPSNTK